MNRTLALLVGLLLGLGSVAGAHATGPGDRAPKVTGSIWINSERQTLAELRGRVVLVEFWTFACFNCENVEASLKGWHERYEAAGLTILAVHSPELSFERNPGRVRAYVEKHGIEYAVCIDNQFRTWKRYANRYWPAMYLIDRTGTVRHVRLGEGGEERMEREIRALLAETPAPEREQAG